jgi:hypothetical protein
VWQRGERGKRRVREWRTSGGWVYYSHTQGGSRAGKGEEQSVVRVDVWVTRNVAACGTSRERAIMVLSLALQCMAHWPQCTCVQREKHTYVSLYGSLVQREKQRRAGVVFEGKGWRGGDMHGRCKRAGCNVRARVYVGVAVGACMRNMNISRTSRSGRSGGGTSKAT